MPKHDKLIEKILSGTSDSNISFKELCSMLIAFGFDERIKGSHHIFSRLGIEEIINIQPQGSNAKAYQVKQIRKLIRKYKLTEQ
jgi:hypothetical protein